MCCRLSPFQPSVPCHPKLNFLLGTWHFQPYFVDSSKAALEVGTIPNSVFLIIPKCSQYVQANLNSDLKQRKKGGFKIHERI